jgi:hypothetical protein
MAINDEDELAAALRRAEDLVGCANGSEEEQELAQIEHALQLYACLVWAQAHAANDNLAPG